MENIIKSNISEFRDNEALFLDAFIDELKDQFHNQYGIELVNTEHIPLIFCGCIDLIQIERYTPNKETLTGVEKIFQETILEFKNRDILSGQRIPKTNAFNQLLKFRGDRLNPYLPATQDLKFGMAFSSSEFYVVYDILDTNVFESICDVITYLNSEKNISFSTIVKHIYTRSLRRIPLFNKRFRPHRDREFYFSHLELEFIRLLIQDNSKVELNFSSPESVEVFSNHENVRFNSIKLENEDFHSSQEYLFSKYIYGLSNEEIYLRHSIKDDILNQPAEVLIYSLRGEKSTYLSFEEAKDIVVDLKNETSSKRDIIRHREDNDSDQLKRILSNPKFNVLYIKTGSLHQNFSLNDNLPIGYSISKIIKSENRELILEISRTKNSKTTLIDLDGLLENKQRRINHRLRRSFPEYSFENLTNILDHLKKGENIINQGYKNHNVVKYNLRNIDLKKERFNSFIDFKTFFFDVTIPNSTSILDFIDNISENQIEVFRSEKEFLNISKTLIPLDSIETSDDISRYKARNIILDNSRINHIVKEFKIPLEQRGYITILPNSIFINFDQEISELFYNKSDQSIKVSVPRRHFSLSLKLNEKKILPAYFLIELSKEYVRDQISAYLNLLFVRPANVLSSRFNLNPHSFFNKIKFKKSPKINRQKQKIKEYFSIQKRINQDKNDEVLGALSNKSIKFWDYFFHEINKTNEKIGWKIDNMLLKSENFEDTYFKDKLKSLSSEFNSSVDLIKQAGTIIETGSLSNEKKKLSDVYKLILKQKRNFNESNFAVKINNHKTLEEENPISFYESFIISCNLTSFDRLLNEILSNTEKYAFETKSDNNICWIDFDVILKDENYFLSLKISNNGIPFPKGYSKDDYIMPNKTSEKGSGLGGAIIDDIVTKFGDKNWELNFYNNQSKSETDNKAVEFSFLFKLTKDEE